MRLQNYLKEAIKVDYMDPEEQALLILKKCSKYVKLTKKTGPFTRSVRVPKTDVKTLIRKDVRKDRNPLGMMTDTFEDLNKWLEKNKHNRRDKSVCACANSGVMFGTQFYFFPIGNFSYTWIKAKDINRIDKQTGWSDFFPDMFFDMFFDNENYNDEFGEIGMSDEHISEKKFSSFFVTDKGIEIAYKNGYEIWFNCKQYYLVDKRNFDMFEKLKFKIKRDKMKTEPKKNIRRFNSKGQRI